MTKVCVAFKAHMGWVNAVAVRRGATPIECRDARRVDLVSGSDREVLEPYHLAGGWHGLEREPPPPDPADVVRRGRRRQVRSATDALTRYREALGQAGMDWRKAVVLTARGSLAGDLERILSSHARIHVAEGEAVREATRRALDALGIEYVDQDEKDVPALAADALGQPDPDGHLRSVRPGGVSAWRREERLLAMAAWLRAGR